MQARGMCSLPRNRQQIANLRREHHTSDSNVLYSVMVSCKLAQGTQEAFVRDVKAAPDPQSILFYDWQIADMERLLTHEAQFGILTVDPTYNLGKFYVTPVTYPHLMLEDVTSKQHPLILGPVLVHQRMEFATFNYFISSLIGFSKKLRNVRAFGTDGQEALIEALSHGFPAAVQLRCFIHFKRNITEKLTEYGVSGAVADEFLADIFGKKSGSIYFEGLVDSTSEEDFNHRLKKCKEVWDAREMAKTKTKIPKFYDYFSRYKAKAVCFTMRKDLRIKAGLGSPPKMFTTNASESINAVLKQKVNFKESEWPEFNDKVKMLVKQQREEVIRALSGRGQYRLSPNYSHFAVSVSEWTKMRPEQRRNIIAKFDNATLKSRLLLTHGGGTASVEKTLSVTAEDSGITKLTLPTLEHMWDKAEKLLSSKNAITLAPGDDPTARMVLSSSLPLPHLVKRGSGSQYVCDSRCINWASSGICSHSLAVAEVNNDLHGFLLWYNNSTVQPNITTLAMSGLPSGRGRKGGVPPRRRSRKVVTTPEVSTLRPVFLKDTPSVSISASNVSNVSASQQVSVNQSVTPIQSSACDTLTQLLSGVLPFQCTSLPLSTSASLQPNSNPFYVKFIQGNIRMCQGCKSSLRCADSTIPTPPFNLAVARSEKRQFRDKMGNLITPQNEQTCHYHLRLDCIGAVEPTFVAQALKIPADILPSLTIVHKEYLKLVFKLVLS